MPSAAAACWCAVAGAECVASPSGARPAAGVPPANSSMLSSRMRLEVDRSNVRSREPSPAADAAGGCAAASASAARLVPPPATPALTSRESPAAEPRKRSAARCCCCCFPAAAAASVGPSLTQQQQLGCGAAPARATASRRSRHHHLPTPPSTLFRPRHRPTPTCRTRYTSSTSPRRATMRCGGCWGRAAHCGGRTRHERLLTCSTWH